MMARLTLNREVVCVAAGGHKLHGQLFVPEGLAGWWPLSTAPYPIMPIIDACVVAKDFAEGRRVGQLALFEGEATGKCLSAFIRTAWQAFVAAMLEKVYITVDPEDAHKWEHFQFKAVSGTPFPLPFANNAPVVLLVMDVEAVKRTAGKHLRDRFMNSGTGHGQRGVTKQGPGTARRRRPGACPPKPRPLRASVNA